MDAHLAGISAGLAIVCARRLGNRDDALDATQETIARLLMCVREGRITCSSELAPVAYGIARHVIADVQRVRARDCAGDADAAPAALPNALDSLVREEDRRALAIALDRLSRRDRDLLRRCFVDGEAISRIAGELREPAERVRKRKSRALQRLALLLSHAKPSVTKNGLAR